jgi:Ni,Fe-hydrogenase III large subunit/Ni,Fe-hydrogenase III component G
MLAVLQQEFTGRVRTLDASLANQRYVSLDAWDVPAAVKHLRVECGAKVAMVFAEDRLRDGYAFHIYHVIERTGDPVYLILRSSVAGDRSRFPSLAAEMPSLNWQEREIQDLFGLEAFGHPNPRRVALHDNWPDVHPLRKDFSIDQVLPPFTGQQHEYRPTLGEGVFQIPVGPVHAGIIEPGHFNFAVAGEPILYLQLRMFYVHKGIEKLFEHLPLQRCVFLAESISGDSAFSHGTAFCQAIERAAGIEVPPRARYMRTSMLELERISNHIADIGAIATDVGFVVANAHAGRLREKVVSINEELTGSRALRCMVSIGGVRRDWSATQVSALLGSLDAIEREFNDLVALIRSSDSTRDRLERTGVLQPEKAKTLGIVGTGGRASGIDRDVRRDHPYAAYDQLPFRVPVYQAGDVLHRMKVRMDEVVESFAIVRAACGALPEGPFTTDSAEIPAGRCALSAVEGCRGEIMHWVRTAPGNRLERCKIKDPSLNNWPALVEAVQGNIVPDFPVINKSFNLSYSGTDR